MIGPPQLIMIIAVIVIAANVLPYLLKKSDITGLTRQNSVEFDDPDEHKSNIPHYDPTVRGQVDTFADVLDLGLWTNDFYSPLDTPLESDGHPSSYNE